MDRRRSRGGTQASWHVVINNVTRPFAQVTNKRSHRKTGRAGPVGRLTFQFQSTNVGVRSQQNKRTTSTGSNHLSSCQRGSPSVDGVSSVRLVRWKCLVPERPFISRLLIILRPNQSTVFSLAGCHSLSNYFRNVRVVHFIWYSKRTIFSVSLALILIVAHFRPSLKRGEQWRETVSKSTRFRAISLA